MYEIVNIIMSRLFSTTSPIIVVVPPQDESKGNYHEDRARRDKKVVNNIMNKAQRHLVVAALLIKMTFTTRFTLSRGFENYINSHNKEMVILVRRTIPCIYCFGCHCLYMLLQCCIFLFCHGSKCNISCPRVNSYYPAFIIWQLHYRFKQWQTVQLHNIQFVSTLFEHWLHLFHCFLLVYAYSSCKKSYIKPKQSQQSI